MQRKCTGLQRKSNRRRPFMFCLGSHVRRTSWARPSYPTTTRCVLHSSDNMALEPDTHFTNVLHGVPHALRTFQMALATRHPVSHRWIPGSGLRKLRLVSKAVRSVIDSSIHSYTLNLTGESTLLLEEIRFLKRTRLSQLRIISLAGEQATPLVNVSY